MRRRDLSFLVAGSAAVVFTACGGPSPTPPSSAATPPPSSEAAAEPAPATSSGSSVEAGGLAGKTVVIDPGHNGRNAANPSIINKPVPDGRGGTKACNTTGTATNAGYNEHEFTWDVATRVRQALTARGVKVIMTRENNTGVGPCVDERAKIGNRASADAVVSIHADGANSPTARGFHIIYSAPPLNAAQREPAAKLAGTVRDSLRAKGFPASNYVGKDGLHGRPDIAGMNHSTVPAVLVECGNMRHPEDAAQLSSAAGRARYASAILDGVLRYLG
ncbi:N-acetylmuramoyl-L-alanine amidase [Allokutzneria sp. A3M-2-11 16]|uniref:N-acetylmuramoyl-L-alanine amidase n=1 Tax=Allokutzneria sp. A3M-2-11 16 TaxID=2962043 RepID=UPI0020B8F90C|nr:N-acetylmuramoyl-L-alanine amidase [Allokutzneria sp. A3M-2-11 16]MCP3799816.1 N-acetylmuramoyl-L-alanine amidase [Allokutzneria sp. A3M-2-11 16]